MNHSPDRTGSVYLAVLGTSLIVSVLALSALAVQRLQSRVQSASSDAQQAQLNAAAAVELGLLAIKQDENWRDSAVDGAWFSDRGTGIGTCGLEVSDPVDADLTNDPDDPVLLVGIGSRGQAQQRLALTVYPQRGPLGCLHSALAAGDQIALNADALRASGLITANQVAATASLVYGDVEATTISGATYYGTSTQIDGDDRPDMPDWDTVFDYYQANGTEININDLPAQTPNLGHNVGIESGAAYWTGTPTGIATATISQSNTYRHGGTYSLKVENRNDYLAGAAQPIDDFVKPGQQYLVECWVYMPSVIASTFRLSVYTKGTGGAAQYDYGGTAAVASATWTKLSATLTAPPWSGSLEYAFVKVGGAIVPNTVNFYVDDLDIREVTTGRLIYRKVLGPGVNPFGLSTNAQGLYWINCAGNKLVIERSRIRGTLLILNPGAGSEIGAGPIDWSPAVPGYPALLVAADDPTAADFSIHATSQGLSELADGVNYNPLGAPHDEFGTDLDLNDIYPSEIRGIVAIGDDLAYQNAPLVRGQVLVGDDVANSSGTLEIQYDAQSALNPPPGFWGPYIYSRRPAAAAKDVAP